MSTPIDRVEQMFTAGDGFDYVCEPLDAGVWRCGKCHRGIVTSKDRKCRVCKRPVSYRISSLFTKNLWAR